MERVYDRGLCSAVEHSLAAGERSFEDQATAAEVERSHQIPVTAEVEEEEEMLEE